MKLLVESADNVIAKKLIDATGIADVIESVEYEEDNVGFGDAENVVILGLVFVWESVLSGVTWDIIKESIVSVLGKLSDKQRSKTTVSVLFKSTNERIETTFTTDKNHISVELPDKLKILIKND